MFHNLNDNVHDCTVCPSKGMWKFLSMRMSYCPKKTRLSLAPRHIIIHTKSSKRAFLRTNFRKTNKIDTKPFVVSTSDAYGKECLNNHWPILYGFLYSIRQCKIALFLRETAPCSMGICSGS